MLALATAAVMGTGCYHATIVTGLPEAQESIHHEWALAWIRGIVPPPTVETAAKCKNGVAKIESQVSLLNGLVTAVTYNIFSPMDLKATCAASSKMGAIPTDAIKVSVGASASDAEYARAVALAATMAQSLAEPVYVAR
jgi:hypothetical protein